MYEADRCCCNTAGSALGHDGHTHLQSLMAFTLERASVALKAVGMNCVMLVLLKPGAVHVSGVCSGKPTSEGSRM